MRDIAGKLRALIVALGDDGARLAAAYREVAAAEAALADDAAKTYAEVPRTPTTDADRERVVREVRGAIADALDAGVLSSDAPVVLSPADADRVAALIEERPGPTEAMRALFAERRPCAGWGDPDAYGDRMLRTGDGPRWILGASMRGGWAVTSLSLDRDGAPCWTVVAQGESPTIDAAMIAAEDSLRAIAAEILRAVGA